MNRGWCFLAVMLVLVSDQLVASEEAATCNPSQLSPCLGALQSGSTPSQDCCSKLKSQQPCLCGYAKNPNFKQYFNSPNARKVAGQCGVSIPSC